MRTDENIVVRRNKEKIVSDKMILLFFSLLFSITIMFIFLIPQYEQTRIKEMETELIRKTLESKRDIFIKIASFDRTYKDMSETEINKMYDLLPDNNNFEEHLANIDKLAKRNGILIKNISFSEHKKQGGLAVNKSNLETAEISFSAESSFPNFMSFLSSLEKNIPLVNIDRISITKKNENGDKSEGVIIDNNIETEIKLLFYYL